MARTFVAACSPAQAAARCWRVLTWDALPPPIPKRREEFPVATGADLAQAAQECTATLDALTTGIPWVTDAEHAEHARICREAAAQRADRQEPSLTNAMLLTFLGNNPGSTRDDIADAFPDSNRTLRTNVLRRLFTRHEISKQRQGSHVLYFVVPKKETAHATD